MSRLIQLPNGTYIDPEVIRLIEARQLIRAFVDRDGVSWPATLRIETRNQVLQVPFPSVERAAQVRDMLAAVANARHTSANREAAHHAAMPSGTAAERTPPGLATHLAEANGASA